MNEKIAKISICPADASDQFLISIEGGKATVENDVKRSDVRYTRRGLQLTVEASSIEIIEEGVTSRSAALIKSSGTQGKLIAYIPDNWNIGH